MVKLRDPASVELIVAGFLSFLLLSHLGGIKEELENVTEETRMDVVKVKAAIRYSQRRTIPEN